MRFNCSCSHRWNTLFACCTLRGPSRTFCQGSRLRRSSWKAFEFGIERGKHITSTVRWYFSVTVFKRLVMGKESKSQRGCHQCTLEFNMDPGSLNRWFIKGMCLILILRSNMAKGYFGYICYARFQGAPAAARFPSLFDPWRPEHAGCSCTLADSKIPKCHWKICWKRKGIFDLFVGYLSCKNKWFNADPRYLEHLSPCRRSMSMNVLAFFGFIGIVLILVCFLK